MVSKKKKVVKKKHWKAQHKAVTSYIKFEPFMCFIFQLLSLASGIPRIMSNKQARRLKACKHYATRLVSHQPRLVLLLFGSVSDERPMCHNSGAHCARECDDVR